VACSQRPVTTVNVDGLLPKHGDSVFVFAYAAYHNECHIYCLVEMNETFVVDKQPTSLEAQIIGIEKTLES
jgi:hypothetical protein